MRKFVWGGTAVVVLSAVAVYLAADYAAHHPDSWFGRCTAFAGYLGSKCNPFTGLAAAAQSTSGEGTPVSRVVSVPKPEAMPDLADAVPEVVAGDRDEAIEPIRVEPQPGFILPVEVEAFPQAVPASEETLEPRFGGGEESELPAQVAAPAHEDEQGTPPAMPYVEDDAPMCKTCASCPQGCCTKGTGTKGTCTKDCSNGCCAKPSCCEGCAKSPCAKSCAAPASTACRTIMNLVDDIDPASKNTLTLGLGFNSDGGLVGSYSVDSGPCSAKDCCLLCCCDWLCNLLGLTGCGKCCELMPDIMPLFTQPHAANLDSPADELPQDKPKGDSGKNDDVPNCQEDPSYSHQYPSCPYTGAPCNTCPYYPSMQKPAQAAPESNPLDELLPAKRKAKKAPASSLLHLMPQTYTGLFDPIALGVRQGGAASALRAVKMPAAEDCDVHPDVDTMEARPTDVDKVPSPCEPF